MGADYRIGSNAAVGLLAGYAHTDAGLANGGDLEADGGNFGLYARAFGQGFYLDASVIGGYTAYDSRRTALLGRAHGTGSSAELAMNPTTCRQRSAWWSKRKQSN